MNLFYYVVAVAVLGASMVAVTEAETTITTGTCVPNSAECGAYSVARVIDSGNTARGDFCTAGGGVQNMAGGGTYPRRDYAVVGGGNVNRCMSQKSVIAGGSENEITSDPFRVTKNQYSTISGGRHNNNDPDELFDYSTTGSVITGGVTNHWMGESRVPQMVISGGRRNDVEGRQTVVTGGSFNGATGDNSVVLGGYSNLAHGDFSAIPGGMWNRAGGNHSIAMGMRARAGHDNSMVINLQGNKDYVESTADGQFLAQAKQYKFQLTNNPGPNNENVIEINESNIQNLVDAINAPVRYRERELRPCVIRRRKERHERELRRKLQQEQDQERDQ